MLTKGHTHLFLMNQEGELTEDELDPEQVVLEEYFRGPIPEETKVNAMMAIVII